MRRFSKEIKVGTLTIGDNAPISIQSMTTTKTSDVQATAAQIKELEQAGCEIIRVAVPDRESALAISEIKKRIKIPIVADIHFDWRLAIAAIEAGADKIRINPGNIGNEAKVAAIIEKAREKKIPVRIGVNAGSLHKKYGAKREENLAQALVESALEYIDFCEKLNFYDLVISVKSSSVLTTIKAYRSIAKKIDYPLHLGITEAGTITSGTVKSAIGLGILLYEGIGDTIRVSLTANPINEVLVAKEILKTLNLIKGPILISCPTCGRCEVNLIPIAEEVERALLRYNSPITVAVMGCIVNGPGEAREADIGIACGKGSGVLFARGKAIKKVPEKELIKALLAEIEKVAKR